MPDAVLAPRMLSSCVCESVSLSYAGIKTAKLRITKQLHVGKIENSNGITQNGAPNAGGVG